MEHLWSPWRMDYIQSNKTREECIFCQALQMEDGTGNLIVHRGRTAFVILNRYPYTSGHIMVVPKAHLANLWEMDSESRAELFDLTIQSVEILTAEYKTEGFNLGMNLGEAAGAGIADHIHMHIVPRWKGDTNYMATTANTRVLPESLEETYERVHKAWKKLKKA